LTSDFEGGREGQLSARGRHTKERLYLESLSTTKKTTGYIWGPEELLAVLRHVGEGKDLLAYRSTRKETNVGGNDLDGQFRERERIVVTF